uniref:Uncharacterized protein n=1 Tax=viral metagenome TaxID=1070528 RepID=A0A6C0C1T4_9ZZZZ
MTSIGGGRGGSAPEIDAPACDHKSWGTSFRSLSATDWERVENISANVRQVGRMMKTEALRLVTGEAKCTAHKLHINTTNYVALCGDWKLDVKAETIPSKLTGDALKRGGTKKKINAKKPCVKEAMDKRARALDVEKIKSTPPGSCPRWDCVDARPDAYVVAFRLWLNKNRKGKGNTSEHIDKIVSAQQLMKLLSHEPLVLQDIQSDIANCTEDLSFVDALEVVGRNENLLHAPSFSSSRVPLTLYEEQRAVAESVLACMEERMSLLRHESQQELPTLLLRFCTPPSTGKSSAAAYLGAMIEFYSREIRKSAQQALRRAVPYVVYECYSENVRFDVAKMCVAAAIPFAIFSDCLASPSHSCYAQRRPRKKPPPVAPNAKIAYSLELLEQCDNTPVVLVCDPMSAIYFLNSRWEHQSKSVGDVLLLDEPTDKISDTITADHASILQNAAAVTVLMSATCPQFRMLSATISHLQNRFGSNVRLQSVESKRITSPCTVVDAHGNVYAPHRVFRGHCSELRDILMQHLHLKRLYSPRAVLQLVHDIPRSENAAIELVRKLPVSLACSADALREVALDILGVCTPSLELWGDISQSYVVPSPSRLCTTDAHLLPGVSFILSDDEHTVQEVSLTPLSSLGEKLDKHIQYHAQARARVESGRVHEDKGKTDNNSKEDRLSRQRELESFKTAAALPPLWPPWLCVNTKEHMKHFADMRLCETKMTQQIPLVPDDVLYHSCETLVVGLLCGFCTLHSAHGDKALALASQNLAENKSFSFLNGGRSSVYGVNLPCDRVILLFNNSCVSPEEIVQCLGRCGRTGKFSKAEAMFASSALLEYVFAVNTLPDATTTCTIDRLIASNLS